MGEADAGVCVAVGGGGGVAHLGSLPPLASSPSAPRPVGGVREKGGELRRTRSGDEDKRRVFIIAKGSSIVSDGELTVEYSAAFREVSQEKTQALTVLGSFWSGFARRGSCVFFVTPLTRSSQETK